MPADAWTTPSACALWAVRDVVAHLIMAAHVYTDSITRGLRDDTSPQQAAQSGIPSRLPRLRNGSSGQRRRRRELSHSESLGQELLDVFGTTGDHFNHLVASLSPHEWDKPCYHGRGILPVRSLVSGMVFELAIHLYFRVNWLGLSRILR